MNEDLLAFRDQTLRFIEEFVKPNGDSWEEQGFVPRDILQKMGGIGFFGLRFPEEYGGLGLGPLASAVFAEALGTSTYSGFAATVLVHTDMASPHLVHAGSPSQREKYLPGVIAGELITGIAITEPDAGSDVAGLRTSARRDGDGWRLNGTKMFITNGVHGGLFFVAARSNPTETGHRGISMFIVEKGTDGFSVGKTLDKHGWLSSDTAELIFDDCWVPGEALLGEEGQGFYSIMQNFQGERLVLSALAIGESQTALDLTYGYTQTRKAFGATLFDKDAIRQRLAMLQARVAAARVFLYHVAWLMEQGTDVVMEISELKALAGELVQEVTYSCQQFHGGTGYIRGTAIERLRRDGRIASIGGGATEVMLEEIAKRSYI
ncbi:MAG: acyl-CoA dehydrogenase family protein [Acidimicrobiia bacterium]|nr:acyl-CoA dehydrogenase family protein [Acidimicrobiia bacterium]